MGKEEASVAPAKTMQQVADQYRVVVHFARCLALVHEQSIEAHTSREQSAAMIDLLGKRSASIMESLGDFLNGMDAVDEDEDAWTHPIFRVAQATWPRSRECSVTPLETFFATAWRSFLDGDDIEDALLKSGLGFWRDATQAEIDAGFEGEVGDQVLVLTDAGKVAISHVHQPTPVES